MSAYDDDVPSVPIVIEPSERTLSANDLCDLLHAKEDAMLRTAVERLTRDLFADDVTKGDVSR